MTFASFFVDVLPMNEGEEPIDFTIRLNEDTITDLKLPNDNLDGGLVSINKQFEHYKLLDFFLREGVPKSIANFFIKEINVAKPTRNKDEIQHMKCIED